MRKQFFVVLLSVIVVPGSAAGTGSFRFAWLSDTHVGGSTGAEDLCRAVRDINAMSGIDFVLVSGDVTEFGSNEQLLLARSILDSLHVPVHVLPGNHDTKWSESAGTMFPAIWGNDRFVFEQAGILFVGLHQGPRMRMGDGHWAPEDVRWLDSVLAARATRMTPVVLVTHYPVDSSIANWYRVLDTLKQFNTQVILVGHGHGNRALDFEGIPGVMGRSSLRARDSLGGFSVVELHRDTLFFSERISGRETRPHWHCVPMGRRERFRDVTKYPRPDFSVNAAYPHVRCVWKYEAGYTIASTPAVWKDVVIVGDASGTVHGISLDGGLKTWSFITGGPVYSSPAVADGRVVMGSADGTVYCLDAEKGGKIWRFGTGAPVVASPVIADGVVYIGSSDRIFRALRLSDGHLLWSNDGLRGFVETRPLVYDGKVIFGAWDTHLYALDARTGTLSWKWTGNNIGTLLSPAACWPVGARGMVFIVAPDRMLTALDANTGMQRWRTGRYQVRESIGLSHDGLRVYVRTMRDSIVALSAGADTADRVWVTNAGFGYDINSAMLVEKDGVVFFGTKNGLVIALDGATGTLRWKHRTGAALVNTVCPLDDREVVLSTVDGEVMLLRARK